MTHFDRLLIFLIAALGLASPASRAAPAFAPAPRGALFGDAQVKFELAQGYGLPPGDVGDPGGGPYQYQRPQQGAASLLVRIDRLENQLRQMNGQIEQLQFQNRKLEEQLRKFQEDVDFRFRDGGRRGEAAPETPARPMQRHSDASEGPPGPAGERPGEAASGEAPRLGSAAAEPIEAPPHAAGRRSDAFDPSADPNAPGAPRPLGSQAASAPIEPGPDWSSGQAAQSRSVHAGPDRTDPDAPLDLSGGRYRHGEAAPAALSDAPAIAAPGGAAMAGVRASPVKDDYELALGYYRQSEYENAEKKFTAFLRKNPKSKMAPDAIYYLGESYFQRGRQREAAEQYLKISTDYSSAARAPEAMLRLGQSLYALGAKEQACATFIELAHKYPNAAHSIKAGAERESKRAKC
jgi:tol-pal system protein YbgF